MKRKLLLLIAALSLFAAAGAVDTDALPAADTNAAASSPRPAHQAIARAPVIAILTVHDMIDDGLDYSIRRRVEAARAEGAQIIFFDVDTFGGRLDSIFAIVDFVGKLDLKTVAYVSNKAISAGALFCMACDEIVMREQTTIGDCQPIAMGGESGYIVLGEKHQSPLRAEFRSLVEKKGYPLLLAEAMVTAKLEVWRITRNGRHEYLDKTQYEMLVKDMKPEAREALQPKRVVREDELLTMTATEAKDYDFARAVVKDREEALDLYLGEGGRAVLLEPTWSEEMVRFLNHPAVTSILLTVGLIALYMAFKIPGMGLPEGVAIFCFAILFLSKYLVGLATTFDIALFCVGVALLAVEVFLIPGFGITGISGIICIIAGLVLMLQRFTLPKFDYQLNDLIWNLVTVLGSLIGSVIGFFVIARFVPSTPLFHRLALSAQQSADTGYTVEARETPGLVGCEGVAATDLHPAGRMELGDRILDVVTQGDFIEAGSRVKIIAARGTRVVVTKA